MPAACSIHWSYDGPNPFFCRVPPPCLGTWYKDTKILNCRYSLLPTPPSLLIDLVYIFNLVYIFAFKIPITSVKAMHYVGATKPNHLCLTDLTPPTQAIYQAACSCSVTAAPMERARIIKMEKMENIGANRSHTTLTKGFLEL